MSKYTCCPLTSFYSSLSGPAPCQPENVRVNLECTTNVASVSWENSGPDQFQVVSAIDSRGAVTTCNSSSSNCTFDQLTCGESYVVSVVGHTDACSSQAAVAEMFHAGICTAVKILLNSYLFMM